jgi:MerR family transcriptional regulator, light-induced transcriptional regulator
VRDFTGTGHPVPEIAAHGDAEQPLLGVTAAARRLGVAPATLRTWDRRYGLGPTEHTPGQHRRYTAADLARLDLMRRALLRGATAGEAARMAASASPAHAPAPRDAGAAPWPEPSPSGQGDRAADTADEVIVLPRSAGGGVLRLAGAGPRARGLGRAAAALDAPGMRALLASSIAADGVVATWDEVVRPVLVAAGRRWAHTGLGVEIEHVLTVCVLAAFALPPAPVSSRVPVLLAGLPGEQHTLAISALAAALVERGTGCRPLGPDLPADALAAAIRRTAPAAVVLWSQTAATADPDLLRALPRTRPQFRTYAAGPGWAGCTLPPQVQELDSLVGACAEITRAVAV